MNNRMNNALDAIVNAGHGPALDAAIDNAVVALKASRNWLAIWEEALAAGHAAGEACAPRPMVVGWRGQDGLPKHEIVADGLCGFAWVNVPGNEPFGRWAKKAGIMRADYPKGVCYWVGEFNQSHARKVACADAIAHVLREHGIKANARDRLD
jgi:hypothetical protein